MSKPSEKQIRKAQHKSISKWFMQGTNPPASILSVKIGKKARRPIVRI